MNNPWLFELGVEAESDVSGFKGIITSRSEHLNGCNRYWLQPKIAKDGKMPDGCWIDEGELIVLAKPKIKRPVSQKGNTGGFPSMVK